MKRTISKIASFVVATTMMLGPSSVAFAAPATGLSDNMTTQKVGETSDHAFEFTLPTALSAGGDVTFTFPAGFDASGAVVGSSTPTATLVSATTTVVTIDYEGAENAGTTYNVTLTGIDNPATDGPYTIELAADNGDTGEFTVQIITDDQIQVSAKVNQTLSFDVTTADTDNAVGFGSLSATAITYATDNGDGDTSETAGGASQFTAATNATGGYTVSVEGETLSSGSDTITAIAGTSPTSGQEEFGLTIDSVSGSTGTITSSYTGTNYNLPATGTSEVVATQTAPADPGTYGVNYVANISGGTPAGNYSTALTYTMTANF